MLVAPAADVALACPVASAQLVQPDELFVGVPKYPALHLYVLVSLQYALIMVPVTVHLTFLYVVIIILLMVCVDVPLQESNAVL